MSLEDPYYNDYYEDDYEDESDDPCDNCGPSCRYWMGDGLCELVIEEQARQREEYEKHIRMSKCPVCGKELQEFDIPNSDQLWIWSAKYDPTIALEVYGPIWLKKGEIHAQGQVHHVWIEWGTGVEERLIRLLGKEAE